MNSSSTSADSATTSRWATWRTTVLFAAAVLLARIAYLVWLCPYELAADEAHYWEWSRHPGLSYYSKGPGVAWLIASSTRLFGIAEWSVRLPATFAALIATLGLARFATAMARGDERAGFLAAVLFTLTPVFSATALFMTIDGPHYACWILASLAAWRICTGDVRLRQFAWLGFLIGVGVLFKYTILLLLPAVLFLILRRVDTSVSRRHTFIGVVVLLIAMAAAASPVLIWNHREGWPTVAHLLGHAGLPGGDIAAKTSWQYQPIWTLGYLLYPFIVLGPPVAILLVLAAREAARERDSNPAVWNAVVFACVTAIPIFAFYLLLSFRSDIELNWAAAGYTVLLAPAAVAVSRCLSVKAPVMTAWRWVVGFGAACALLLAFASWPLDGLSRLGVFRSFDPAAVLLKRVRGHSDLARQVERVARHIEKESGRKSFVAASHYGRTSLLAFYMTNRPVVYCAAPFMGGRESSYDYFPDTSLGDPALYGQSAVLVGTTSARWDDALYFGHMRRFKIPGPGNVYGAFDYRGPSSEPRRLPPAQ